MSRRYPDARPDAITISELVSYLRCGIRWAIERDRQERRITLPMAIGTGVARGAQADNERKIAGGTLLIADVVDAAVSGFDQEVESSIVEAAPIEVDRARDGTAEAALAYARDISPQDAPEDVLYAEQPLMAHVGPHQLVGTPDVITREGVGDVKTGQPWTQDRVDRWPQLTHYGILHREARGHYPGRFWIDSISPTRNGWRGVRFPTYRDWEDYEAHLTVINHCATGMKRGVTLPAPPTAWHCSQKWCPHHGTTCPAVPRRRNRIERSSTS